MSPDFYLRGHLGSLDAVDRFAAEIETHTGRQLAEVLWTRSTPDHPDAPARLSDAAALFIAHPHPLVPRVLGQREYGGGLAVITDPLRGLSLDELTRRPPWEASLAVVRTIAEFLTEINALRGRFHRRFSVVYRSLATDTVWLRTDGTLALQGVHGLAGRWEQRTADTDLIGLSLPPDATPETRRGEKGGLPVNAYLLGLVLFELVWGRQAAGALQHRLGEIDDPRRFDAVLAKALAIPRLDLPVELAPCARGMLAFYPDERPSLAEIVDQLADIGASDLALETFASRHVRVPHDDGSRDHPLVGTGTMPGVRSAPKTPVAAPPRPRSGRPATPRRRGDAELDTREMLLERLRQSKS